VKSRGISTAAAASALARELRATSQENRPLVVDGARELAALLRRELTRGGVAEAVREGGPLEGAAGVVYVLAGPAGPADVERLREASRAKIPAVCVIAAREGERVPDPPYVLPEHIVRVEGGGSGFPVEAVTRAIAAALGQHATALAARLPVLRDAVCEELIRHFSRQNAVIGVAVFVPGADLPVLTLNQVRLLLRIADAYGFELDRERLPEVLGVIGSAYGFRALARSVLGLVPLAGWAVKGGIAFVGTRALGEAARRYFEARAPVTRVPGDRAVFPR
jgi:uncharacterized protein (DUF697 family)